MSTVIRPAYRTQRGVDLFELIRDIRPRAEAAASAAIQRFYEELLPAVLPATDRYRALFDRYKDDRMVRLSLVHDLVERGYRMQLGRPYRGPFNLDASLAIRELDGAFYIRPHCDWTMGRVFDFLAEDKRLEDYSYWNNVDRPKDVTARAWRRREQAWDRLAAPRGRWRATLTLDVCSWSDLQFVDPFWKMSKAARAARDERQATEDAAWDDEVRLALAADPTLTISDVVNAWPEEKQAAYIGVSVEDMRANAEWRRTRLAELAAKTTADAAAVPHHPTPTV